jgi:hypothetical protein
MHVYDHPNRLAGDYKSKGCKLFCLLVGSLVFLAKVASYDAELLLCFRQFKQWSSVFAELDKNIN